MNYGKKDLLSHKRDKINAEKKRGKRFNLLFLRSLLVFVLVLIGGGIFGVVQYVKNLIDVLPDVSTIDISPAGYSSKVYDATGAEIETLASSGANRVYVTLQEIPDDLENAFVAIEDSRFYEHNGIDLKGILRAGYTGLMSGGHFSQGASTITQQLLKNNYFTGWTEEKTKADSVKRKIQEQYLAVQLEKITDKKDILENYLNTINLGQNTLGVEAAAYRYFNKDVSELTLSEDAVIAAITQNPSGNNPLTHPETNAVRREKVLKNMLNQKMITKEQYNEAINDDVYTRIQSANTIFSGNSTTTYFVDALTDEIIKDLVDSGYTETQAYQKLYAGGLQIYATQDPRIQQICDEEVNNQDNYPTAPKISFSYRLTVKHADGTTENFSDQTMISYYRSGNPKYSINFNSQEEAQAAIDAYKAEVMKEGDTIPEAGETVAFTLQPQVAMTVMDHTNGHVVAQVGGRGDKTASRTLNRATDSLRQPGSTFKIITTYAPALDAAGLTLATVQDDAPYSYTNGKPLQNATHTYQGYTTIRQGIYDSINIVAVKTLTQIGTGLGFQYAQDFGITTLESGDNNQALAIGGISRGVKNYELTAAYATIANKGVYHEPIYYTKVLDHDGNVLLDNSEKEENGRRVIKETTAWLLTSAMQDSIAIGTGKAAAFPGMHIAGKTGTTNDVQDSLMAGFTPYYTCVLWGGNDDHSDQTHKLSIYTKNIWRQAMARIHEGLEDRDFEMPEGIQSCAVCSKSGKRPLEGICDDTPQGNMIYTEYFAKGTVPTETETCDRHVRVETCTESGMVANPFCPDVISEVKILDGSGNTPDGPYAISSDTLNQPCTIHSGGEAGVTPFDFSNVVITEITETEGDEDGD